MDLDTIRVFAITKLGWIKAQQRKLRAQPREPVREYLDRESHYVCRNPGSGLNTVRLGRFYEPFLRTMAMRMMVKTALI